MSKSMSSTGSAQMPAHETNNNQDLHAVLPTAEAQASARFSPEQEAALLAESHAQKAQANGLFAAADYSQAVSEYDKALASCPVYLEFEIAVLRSNIAACHLKLRDWQAAIDSATVALEALEPLLPLGPKTSKKASPSNQGASEQERNRGTPEEPDSSSVVELAAEDEESEKAELKALELSDQRKQDIWKIQAKALIRRAKSKWELGGWANLQGAEDDYKVCLSLALGEGQPTRPQNQHQQRLQLPPQDLRMVRTALQTLPPQINAAKEKEMGDMMGKLKELGNGILKPFGLSTDNFKMVKDEKTGGYNMNFSQG